MELNIHCCIYTVDLKIQAYFLVEKFVIIKQKLNNRPNNLFLDNKVKVQACRNVQLAFAQNIEKFFVIFRAIESNDL